LGSAGCAPFFYILAFALQLRKKHRKTSVRVDEKCPDIPVAAVQYTFTQIVHRTQNGTYITIKRKKKSWKCGPCPVFASYNLAFALQLRKNHGKPSARVVEKCLDIPVAVVQYTFTHKQNTEHNETE
jgi:hypothetical protein